MNWGAVAAYGTAVLAVLAVAAYCRFGKFDSDQAPRRKDDP